MANRIYIRARYKDDVELDAGETIVFESEGAPIRVYFDGAALKVSADERVMISPEASNVFTVRTAEAVETDRAAARRVRKALGQGDRIREGLSDDVRTLIEAVLR